LMRKRALDCDGNAFRALAPGPLSNFRAAIFAGMEQARLCGAFPRDAAVASGTGLRKALCGLRESSFSRATTLTAQQLFRLPRPYNGASPPWYRDVAAKGIYNKPVRFPIHRKIPSITTIMPKPVSRYSEGSWPGFFGRGRRVIFFFAASLFSWYPRRQGV